MTQHTAEPGAPAARVISLARQDYEFLPAALEILETPLSPNRVALMRALAVFVVLAIGWAYFGRIDIVSVMQGKVQPTGRVKVVQPVEAGQVASIRAENGARVKAGDVLIELNTTELRSDEANTAAMLASFKAEATRHRMALANIDRRAIGPLADILWDADIPPAIKARENRVYRSDGAHFAFVLAGFDSQIRQKLAEKDRLEGLVAAQQNLIENISQRVGMREELLRRNAGTKASLIDARETLLQQQTTLASHAGQLAETLAGIDVLGRDRDKVIGSKAAEHSQKLADAERQIDDFEQRLAKIRTRLSNAQLRAPIDGLIFASSVTTIGQVVASGEELLRIVPENLSLEIECYVENKDIGFIKPGQTAVIKIESFPFTRHGTIDAKVVRVARDAIPQLDAQSLESNPAKAIKSGAFAGAQRVQNLVFAVILQPLSTEIEVEGSKMPISAGMAVTAEIRTGSRRILEFLFSPLVETTATAMKER